MSKTLTVWEKCPLNRVVNTMDVDSTWCHRLGREKVATEQSGRLKDVLLCWIAIHLNTIRGSPVPFTPQTDLFHHLLLVWYFVLYLSRLGEKEIQKMWTEVWTVMFLLLRYIFRLTSHCICAKFPFQVTLIFNYEFLPMYVSRRINCWLLLLLLLLPESCCYPGSSNKS